MKKMTLFFLLTLSLTCFSQTKDKEKFNINGKTIIKDGNGKVINYLMYIELTNSGDWIPVYKRNTEGNPEYVKLRKTSAEEKQTIIKNYSNSTRSELTGKKSPKFRMKDLNGNIISSTKTKGKVVVLNFWFSRCKPCILEFPALNEIYQKYKNHDEVVFAAVTFNKQERIIPFLKKYALDYPVVTDAQDVCDQFIGHAYPVNIVIDKNGFYESYTIGGFPEKGLEQSILDALQKD